jgi:2,4-dienoyl-CoA reductase-like NADH-dependent reductase (Old Yellow Enzyme family)
MAKINEPLTIKGVTIKNRIGMSPMCQYSAVNGFANDWHFVHYGTRAVGGTGLIMVEATSVVPEGRITASDLGLWSDTQIVGLQKITNFIQQHGAVAGIQIAHAGRKASHDIPSNGGKQLSIIEGGWHTVAPSPVPFESTDVIPDELDKSEISTIIGQFKATALRAKQAGFKILEIHAAHGYLIHEFYSPLSNKRTDEYGGKFENRIRLLLEVIEAVQTVWPADFPLFVRLSASDWTKGGWDLTDTVELCRILHEKGVDLVDCSSGGNIMNAKIPVAPGYQIQFSEEIRKTGILTSAVGIITTDEQIADILENEKADLVFLGRELLRNPYFPLLSALKTGDDVEWPKQYTRAK